ncbi:hypothetical protein GCM10008922_39270 [Faecalicatena contorta]|nr:hypothetical protein CE91St64_14970 [Faecalicatena contorta]
MICDHISHPGFPSFLRYSSRLVLPKVYKFSLYEAERGIYDGKLFGSGV